ncbi:HAD family phosphatase [Synechococcus sp. ATX 2A4]|uniref:HAD family hydrolase n=1 Tax=Synechococcus sp. ATX 2A4 TaxID=2823727 RepID=UPI0020CE28B5|nr:HAD family phosphatase [Synechococcus sp. ATX 2A4]MCP9883896.1 HAD family phosphatase [Synechococcus sp. ATX 2A4]
MIRPAACLFDLDGLLLDTEPLHARAWREAAAHFGRTLQPQEVLALRGRRRLDCADQVRQWIRQSDGPALSSTDLLAVRQPIAEALLPHAAPMPGAQALVERCHALGIPMALATSSSREAVALKSEPHPWLKLIERRVHGDDPELLAGKPAPDVFLLAARRLGVAPTACWAFEDSIAGARSAQAAGCQVHVLLPADGVCAQYPPEVVCLKSLAELRL